MKRPSEINDSLSVDAEATSKNETKKQDNDELSEKFLSLKLEYRKPLPGQVDHKAQGLHST